ncbi:MAG: 16S rRNA (guanine(527)-N(7))-methyltransferase RsmG [Pseudomonadota bacterium]
MNAAEQLARGIAALGLDLSAPQQDMLLAYARLLAKWNRVYNLTAVRDEDQMITHHLLDSLAVAPHLGDCTSLADIGSGGGLPGVPLAIARPQMRVALVESSHKKSSFLQQARIELALANVTVHCERAEAFQPATPFAVVISRAFSDLPDFVRAAGHLLAPDGRLLAMKGVYPYEEIAQLPAGWTVARVIPLAVPGLEAARHLVCLERKNDNE